jgi:hypothetical protein
MSWAQDDAPPWQQGSSSVGAREVWEQRPPVSNLRRMVPPAVSRLSTMGPSPLCPPFQIFQFYVCHSICVLLVLIQATRFGLVSVILGNIN